MSSISKEKVKKILTELSIELTGTKSIPRLASHLGYTKQALYNWIDNGEIPIESIKSKVEDINPRFLTGEQLKIFKENKNTNQRKPIDDSWDRLEEKVNESGISREVRDQLIASLRDRARNLAEDLEYFSDLVDRLEMIDQKVDD